ncbi:MAG: LacI family transcriptional regulator [Lentisphaerae bacterium]|nr:LacI family transcriptional regulator [Lentisphaerota bacterium]
MGVRMVTMKEIARLANVSQQAVSAALSGTDFSLVGDLSGATRSRVSEKTRKKILKIAAELNYVPSTASRMLKGGSSNTIGIFRQAPFYGIEPLLARELSARLAQCGYDTLDSNRLAMLDDSSRGRKKRMSESSADKIVRMMESKGVAGIIVFPGSNMVVPQKFRVPRLFLRTPENFDIHVDYDYGGRIAVKHLYGHGRRRIAFFSYYESKCHGRMTAWENFLKEAGIYDPELLITGAKIAENGGLPELVRKLKIDAIAVQNDLFAARLIRECLDAGIRVPDDVAMIGYDGLSVCELAAVPIATMVQPVCEIARKSVELLKERIDNKIVDAEFANILFKPKLHCSASCGCPAAPMQKLDLFNEASSWSLALAGEESAVLQSCAE